MEVMGPRMNVAGKTRADGSWILVYWGQYDEATLSSACDKANYDMMVLTILNASGKDQEPPINLSILEADITNCQSTDFTTSDGGLLGEAVPDGRDFDMEMGTSAHYADLAEPLRSLMRSGDERCILTAAPQCPLPDEWRNPVLQSRLLDYVWVHFYSNPECDYKPVPLSCWAYRLLLMELRALILVLLRIRMHPRFGGVML
ncbi:hypothetical protein MPTK1_8g13520 [Marchantia polymorpha subsp. ruderalis]|uniref:chitinase n=1 Tax=Marchantia polymorpha TaxID=3197 RepID=A0A2R6WCF8_MARPO|nr:hypothetical protein MARPO_0110s0035 [Marchantia polymorpha]BBN19772.1 hypothetical protein Mp_8g13520 [Marchantia polymorpha subsp. ruderalis]|eukprot:PTQ31544.1 hypothetical protein MARPO_0110s0035 [Marchantia polymorpha]